MLMSKTLYSWHKSNIDEHIEELHDCLNSIRNDVLFVFTEKIKTPIQILYI